MGDWARSTTGFPSPISQRHPEQDLCVKHTEPGNQPPQFTARYVDTRNALPQRPQRVLVCGVTGVGKTTLAGRLGRLWDLPHTELDALHHGPEWTVRPTFEQDVARLAATERWITEWQYHSKGQGPVLGYRADTLIWLDFPRWIALGRLVRRTLRRRLRRERLWNGNIEPPLHVFFTDPEESILRFEMLTHDKWRERMPQLLREYPHLQVIRLASPREARHWLAGPANQLSG